jgi:hypothetical protein
MYAWVVVREDNFNVVAPAVARARSDGAAEVAHLALPQTRRKPPQPIVVITPAGARARRAPRWPDVLGDWSEINEEALFPSAELAVLAEELSGLARRRCARTVAPGSCTRRSRGSSAAR